MRSSTRGRKAKHNALREWEKMQAFYDLFGLSVTEVILVTSVHRQPKEEIRDLEDMTQLGRSVTW